MSCDKLCYENVEKFFNLIFENRIPSVWCHSYNLVSFEN